MPSLACHLFNGYSRLVIRRRHWGATPEAVARRSRRVFEMPPFLRRLAGRGLTVERVDDASGVRGEWVSAPAGGAAGGAAPAGVVMYVHGGGYLAGTAADRRAINGALARATGCRVFAPEYRTAPEHRFPAALDDVISAYRWLVARGAPVAVAGESAGGGLVLLLAQHARDAGLVPPACVAALSPWTDLAATGASVAANDGRDAMFRPGNFAAHAGAYLGDAPPTDPRASPLYGDAGGLPPVLFHVGATEMLLDDARRMHARIRAAGGESRLEVYASVAHAWHLLVPYMPEAVAAVDDVAAFVGAHLARRARPGPADDHGTAAAAMRTPHAGHVGAR
jgi:acetyl esterase/lipase